MVEIRVPKEYFPSCNVGIWEGSSTSNLGQNRQLYLGPLGNKQVFKFNVSKALVRIREKHIIPVELVCTGITQVPPPIKESLVAVDFDYILSRIKELELEEVGPERIRSTETKNLIRGDICGKCIYKIAVTIPEHGWCRNEDVEFIPEKNTCQFFIHGDLFGL